MQDTLPFVVVSNLPSSAAFYSAVTHPLGLRYISASSASLILGDTTAPDPVPVFEVRLAANTRSGLGRLTRTVFSAASADVVKSFHAAALRANPSLIKTPTVDKQTVGISYLSPDSSSARISDLDGNVMEVVYVNPPEYPSNYDGRTVRHTQSTNAEASRILDWNLDVATSQPARSVAGSAIMDGDSRTVVSRRTSRPYEEDDDGGMIVHRKTTMTKTTHYAQPQAPPTPPKEPDGFATNTLLGSVLGAAAVGVAVGGALTYCLMRNEQSRAPKQEYDAAAPPLTRRSTYPHPAQAQRYIEVERTDRARYSEGYGPDEKKYPPISGSKYSPSAPRSRAMEDMDDSDRRSHYTTGSRARRRSEVSASRQPLLLADSEHRSVASSKHSAVGGPKLLMDHAYRSESGSDFAAAEALFKPVDYHSRAASRAPSNAGTKVTAAASRRSSVSRRPSGYDRDDEDEDDRRSHAGTTRAPPRPVEVESYMSGRTDRSSASTVRPSARPSHSYNNSNDTTPSRRTMFTGEHGQTMDTNVSNILAYEFSKARKPSSSSKADHHHSRRRERSRNREGETARSRAPSAAPTTVKMPVRSSRAPSRAPSHAGTVVRDPGPLTDRKSVV